MMQFIINILREKNMSTIDVDSHARLAAHEKMIQKKKMIAGVFKEFYDICAASNAKYFSGSGKVLEIGSGVGQIKKYYPDVITSEVIESPIVDMVIDATKMDIKDGSLRAVYGLNCFHHISDPRSFFKECERVLHKGGGVVLIDPYYGLLANSFYKKAFPTEFFDKNQKSWSTDSGVMLDANQALSYVVFVRDRAIFEKEFPGMEIVETRVLNNYIRYVFSGGLNFKQLIPNIFTPILKIVEILMIPLRNVLGLHHVIVIKKK
ncbi:class I SAM-dependent methyltransferase [Herbaspirillum sp. RTI4]|uniref:class I SAM-dependent methyltransferase n=1 Tax=Herbaspirillum sp. RTI4 TaxID=3048640 RepID=UPI002AB5AC22|nr:class I SAM-dependent methyltransferase [Herbaspirillum sp. RTI4]MDY7577616.1 class I SAM-dependent methyltransferase [Herbaspirillum sp. RTI4]MEA9983287.1 class I SAM-dependent methyltransferase [Herbaspirillum sp. RTI4]